jgi:hypothetical protein
VAVTLMLGMGLRDFPKKNAYDNTLGGSFNDAFVTKIAP